MDGADEQGIAAFFDAHAERYVAGAAPSIGYGAYVADFLEEHARPGRRVLDVACGPGNLTAHLDPAVAVAGLDVSPEMIALARRARPGGSWHVGSFHAPLPAALGPPFDVVLMMGAFEFCMDLPGVVARLAAAARPGGALLLGIPERREAAAARHALSAPGAPGDVIEIRLFTLEEMLAAFRGAGLTPSRCVHLCGWTHRDGMEVPYAVWELDRGGSTGGDGGRIRPG